MEVVSFGNLPPLEELPGLYSFQEKRGKGGGASMQIKRFRKNKTKLCSIPTTSTPEQKEVVSLSGFIQSFFCFTQNSFNYRCSAVIAKPTPTLLSSDDLIVLTASCAGDASALKP